MRNTRQQGGRWEQVAESFLHQKGLKTVTRNFNGRLGEIDLVMLDGKTLVFTEVRYRGNASHGGAGASVTPLKQRRITWAAKRFLQGEKQHSRRPCRSDVITVGRKEGRTLLNWIRGAFEAA